MSNLEKLTRLVELLREHRSGQQPQNDAPSHRSNSYPAEGEQATYKAEADMDWLADTDIPWLTDLLG